MTHLKVGDQAPNFSGLTEKGETVSLADFAGKKLVLFFYPKDNTPGCTAEACNLRDNYSALQAKGFELLGVSPDSVKKHQNFIKKFDFPFSLLADTELKTIHRELVHRHVAWLTALRYQLRKDKPWEMHLKKSKSNKLNALR
mgnify:CR=1 FL=1